MFDDIPLWIPIAGAIFVVVTLVVVVRVLRRLYGLRRRVHAENAPTAAKISYYTAWIYALSPVDLLPDPILIDDIGVALTAIAVIEGLTRKHLASGKPALKGHSASGR